MLEKDIQKRILEKLARRGVFAWRNNSGMMFGKHKGKKWAVKMGAAGSADIIGILPSGRFLAIEVKQPGKKPSEIQEKFLSRIRNNGGLAFVATSTEDIDIHLEREEEEPIITVE
jgi:hypothetical protein